MSIKNKLTALPLLAAALGLPQALWAQETAVLDTVVVTSSRAPESIREVSSNITVIDRQALEAAPYERIDQILRREGIQIRDLPGQATSSVELRGFRSANIGNEGGFGGRVLILVDGRPAGTGNVARLTKTNVERIEIIRGPAAVQYGTAAMGGVVNVITKQGEGDFSAHLKAGFGSYSFNDQEGGFNGRSGGFDYSLGLYHSNTAGNFKDGDGNTMYNTDNKALYSGSLNLGYNFLDDRHRIGLATGFYDNHVQGTGGSISYGPSTKTSDISSVENENQSYDLTYAGRDEEGFLSWNARYYHLLDKYASYYTRDRATERPYTTDTKMDGTQLQATANWQVVELTAGFDWLQYKTDMYSSYGYGVPHYELSNTAGFMLAKVRLLDDNLIFSGGVRYDRYESDTVKRQATNDNWSPSVGAAYHPTDWLKLRANYAKGFRTPTPSEAAQDFVYTSYYGSTHYYGNPDLNPETSNTYEAGFDLDFDYLRTGLTYFHSVHKNEIRSYSPRTGESTYLNASRDTVYDGLEWDLSFSFGRFCGWDSLDVRPYFKGTAFTRRKAYDDSNNNRPMIAPYVPKYTAAYGVDFDYPEFGLLVNLNAVYTGSRVEQNFGYNYSGNWVDSPAFTTFDLTVDKVLATWADESRISLQASVRNMFDEYYEPTLDYPAPGRNVYIGLRYDYK